MSDIFEALKDAGIEYRTFTVKDHRGYATWLRIVFAPEREQEVRHIVAGHEMRTAIGNMVFVRLP